jgi:hypothetical protein
MAAIEYQSKSEAKVVRERKAVVVERALEGIYEKHSSISPALILQEATRARSPLHKYFEWDDSKAAAKYRLVQAYQMIQASKFVLVLKESGADVPDVVHAQPEVRKLLPAFRGEGFKMRNEVLNEADSRKAFVERKLETLRAWCRSVIDVSELDSTRKAIERLVK